ncbi:O-antigen polymerase [Priestia flexa]|uniref:O-antigen polymerase n=1 Tax=Priestia flexa TaxID=86664 RepID=UPI003FCF0866
MLYNPFYVYTITFTSIIILYGLGWSNLFPNIKLSLIIFFIYTFFCSIIFGYVLKKKNVITYKKIEGESGNEKFITFLIFIGYCLEFIYNGGIPLIQVFTNTNYEYKTFGIPTFHVILLTFNSFYATYLFHLYLSSKEKKVLFNFLILLLPTILIYNRGALIIILISCAFMLLLMNGKMKLKLIITLFLSSLITMYLFGLMGNVRLNNSVNDVVDVDQLSSELILNIGYADESFITSKIPNEYFWGYLYVTSPLANLQATIDDKSQLHTSYRFTEFFTSEILYDFISKRINALYEIDREKMVQVAPSLTVGTFYARSYVYMSWFGPILMYLFMSIVIYVYIRIVNANSKYFVTGLSILNTLILLNSFENMFSFSGLSFQLVYPIIFTMLKK